MSCVAARRLDLFASNLSEAEETSDVVISVLWCFRKSVVGSEARRPCARLVPGKHIGMDNPLFSFDSGVHYLFMSKCCALHRQVLRSHKIHFCIS